LYLYNNELVIIFFKFQCAGRFNALKNALCITGVHYEYHAPQFVALRIHFLMHCRGTPCGCPSFM